MKVLTTAALSVVIGTLSAAPACCGVVWQKIPAAAFSVAPPPTPDSPADKQDFATLLQLQTARTQADCDLAQTMPSPDFDSLFDGSGLLSKPQLAAVDSFMTEVTQYAAKISGVFKQDYRRPRPYNENHPEIAPCPNVERPAGSTSYPSTHAANSALDACVLGQLFPAEADQLASYGKHLGDLRAIVGVHHPSDVAAGQDLAAQICAKLLAQGDFQGELSQVKSSLPAN